MTLRRFFQARAPFRAKLLRSGRIASLALLTALTGGCGGQSSTDTGNPPVVLGQKLRLTATETGVRVTGEAGAVPGGARVDVVNTSSGESATTTAADDGSFELEVDGSPADEYRVYAASSGQSWRTRLTSSGAADTEAGLAGLDYLLQSADGFAPVVETTIRLSFDATDLSFSAGCNSYFGPYTQCDGKLCVSSLGGTEIGCDNALQIQDEWVRSFLEASPRLTQAGPTLTLTGTEATLRFLDREVADPDRPLTGRTWTVDTFFENGAATNFVTPTGATLQFGSDGNLTVSTGCNTGTGAYTRNGQTLTLAPVAYTEAGCVDSNAALSEQRIIRVLQSGDLSLEIDAARLTLMRGDLGVSATTE